MKSRGLRWNGDAAVIAGFLVFEVLLTLLVLVRSPQPALPGFPRYRYNPLAGDGYGYYSAVRELLNTWQREGRLVLPLTFLACTTLVVVWVRVRSAVPRALAAVWAFGLIAAVLVERVRFTSAAEIGWPLVWSVPVLPYRAAGLPLDPNIAYGFGLTLSLICNAVTITMTYALGRLATDRRSVALLAAGLVAAWPVLMLLDPQHRSAQNGTWQILLGLSMYTEPLSTALVVSGLVVLLRRAGSDVDAVAGGALLGLAALVRVSNGLIAACVILALLAHRDRRRALIAAAGGLAFLPALILFWPKGYPRLHPPVYPAHPFELAYARSAWTSSLLWHPSVLIAIVPIIVVGAFFVDRFVGAVLAAAVLVTAVFYTFYKLTPLHPRFLFVAVPLALVLWAAGAVKLVSGAAAFYHRTR